MGMKGSGEADLTEIDRFEDGVDRVEHPQLAVALDGV